MTSAGVSRPSSVDQIVGVGAPPRNRYPQAPRPGRCARTPVCASSRRAAPRSAAALLQSMSLLLMLWTAPPPLIGMTCGLNLRPALSNCRRGNSAPRAAFDPPFERGPPQIPQGPLDGGRFGEQGLPMSATALPLDDVLGPQHAPHPTHLVLVVLGGSQGMAVLPMAVCWFAGMREEPFLGRAVDDPSLRDAKFLGVWFFGHGCLRCSAVIRWRCMNRRTCSGS
jgi:hypothetical protein